MVLVELFVAGIGRNDGEGTITGGLFVAAGMAAHCQKDLDRLIHSD